MVNIFIILCIIGIHAFQWVKQSLKENDKAQDELDAGIDTNPNKESNRPRGLKDLFKEIERSINEENERAKNIFTPSTSPKKAEDNDRVIREDRMHSKAREITNNTSVTGKYAPYDLMQSPYTEGEPMTEARRESLIGHKGEYSSLSRYRSTISPSREFKPSKDLERRKYNYNMYKKSASKPSQSDIHENELQKGLQALYNGDVDEARKAIIYSEIFRRKY